jgi:DNA-binding MarR family transcriptional regulator
MNGHEVALALRTAYLSMHRRTNAITMSAGVTADQFVVLSALAHNRALTQRALAERTSSDPNTLRAMLILLEREGLIQRLPSPTDGRARTVALTIKGNRTFQKLWTQSESLRAELVSSLTKRESAQLLRLLQQLSEPAVTPRSSASRRTHVVAEAGAQ